ncbi:MAG TPA: glycerophosphodiester phosphodiesterase [Blastocatellia bacterium]|nr:glycerophosphodiester phosphodiesterase [Blastocatellia bacterium]
MRKITPRLVFVLLVWFSSQAVSHPHSYSQQPSPAARPLVIAHRGGAQEFTENTIGAFTRAVKIGAEGIETDIRLTSDGVVVVYHDDQFGRVEGLPKSGSAKLISDLSYQELTARPLKAVGADPGGERVPTLKELLEGVTSGLLNIELKRCARFDELVDKTAAMLKDFKGLDRVVLEAPDLQTAEKLRAALGPHLKLHINPGYDDAVPYEVALKKVLAFRPHSISVSYKKCSREIVELAHNAGVEVWVWTVNDADLARAMMILGADAIKTDQPTKLLELRSRMLSVNKNSSPGK